MAAIGASPIAKTLAVAYILFKVIAVRFALVSFPVVFVYSSAQRTPSMA